MMYQTLKLILTSLILLLLVSQTIAQKAVISEEIIEIPTYPFSDPNPIATLVSNPGIYPYHKFEGYSHNSKPQNWKVITLENDYLKVLVLPEAGGKVWGAIEKSTGKDFIYQNQVMKFRNIAMRGPWTSGGIEFNFGIIGHTPATATPVDYVISEGDDGSVSCTVGMIDLPSRTQWRVKITLPADKAYFTTNATWYNPTALTHPYYNWMTAAAKTTSDLAFYYPGNISLEHSGDITEWPVGKQGRQLWQYQENDFGPSKSYHVTGQYHNFFGGYWHDEDIGFAHSGRHETMPGQKLWLWSLARDGGIWEDLLTDNNGQYMEFQAGRLLNQYTRGGQNNPITEMAFSPHLTDQWEERWFPVKGIGGITSVSESLVLNIIKGEKETEIKINALAPIEDNFELLVNGELVEKSKLSLKPMDVFSTKYNQEGVVTIKVGNETIYDTGDEKAKELKRPYRKNSNIELSSSQKHFLTGSEFSKRRNYVQAKSELTESLKLEPGNMAARRLLAEIHFRNGDYKSALEESNIALRMDTYDFDANYMAGLSYKALGDKYNALDALAIAGRSMKYRSAAYTEIAQLELSNNQLDIAIIDAQYALEFNSKNVSALQILVIGQRLKSARSDAAESAQTILAIDPLNHFAHFENYLLHKKPEDLSQFKKRITNEFPYQTYLEIASIYINANRFADASIVLAEAPDHALISLWRAYCKSRTEEPFEEHLNRGLKASCAFVFPYRQESILVLEWARSQTQSWKLDYYLGMNYWSKNRLKAASELFQLAGSQPEIPSFYVARSVLLSKTNKANRLHDLKKALEIGEEHWRYHHAIIKYYGTKKQYTMQLKQARIAAGMFPENYIIGLDLAQSLLKNKKYDQCLEVLEKIQVLPSEGSFSGRKIYGKASLLRAVKLYNQDKFNDAKKQLSLSYVYPENMGSGKPFDPDERDIDFFMGMIENQLGNPFKCYYRAVINYSNGNENSKLLIFKLLALKELEEYEAIRKLVKKTKSNTHPNARWVIKHWQMQSTPIYILKKIGR